MEKVKTSKKLLCILIALMMLLSSFPLSFVQAATAVEEDCTVCSGYGFLPCTAHGCENGKVKVDCSVCSGTGSISQTCDACTGTGIIGEDPCSTCSGTGTIESACTNCGATGKVDEDCQVCNGTSYVECTNCAGTGKVTNEYETCPDCEGEGKVQEDCNTCDGDGLVQVNCSDCNGTGSISSSHSCTTCSGTGTVDVESDCPVCGGTGSDIDSGIPCANCSETGKVSIPGTCNTCGGSGTVNENSNCTTCSATGKVDATCNDCHGSGKIAVTCTRCAGKGKLLTLNDDSFAFESNTPQPIKVGDSFTNAASSTNNTSGSITYQSENAEIATVDTSGTISAKKAGTVKIKASIGTDYTYSSKEIEYSITIDKGVPTVESFDVGAISYQQTLANSTFSNVVAKVGDITVPGTAAWKTTTIAPTVSDSQNTEYTAVFTPNDTTNFESVEFNAKLTVNPIDITGVSVSGATVNYDGESYDSVAVTGTVAGDTVEYSTDEVNYSPDNPQIKDVADSKTVYVRVTRNNNYNVYNTSAAATVNPAAVGSVHFTVYNGTYDGTAHKGVIVGSPIINGTDPVDHYVYNGTNYSECPEFTDAGEYDFTVVLSNNYIKDGSREVSLRAVISKADVSITAKDRTVVYNANNYTAIPAGAQSPDDYAIYTLQGSDVLASCEADGEAKTFGTYDVGLKNAVIMRGETDATANYNITYPTGKLTIAKADAVITAKDRNVVYNSNNYTAIPDDAQSVDDYATYTLQGSDTLASCEADGEALTFGSYDVGLKNAVIKNGEEDVTANYNITYPTGKLTIAKADASITAKDRTVVYNANNYIAIPADAQGVDDYAIYTLQGSDILESCEADGEALTVGSYDVGLKNAVIKRNGEDVTANYNLTYPTGKLTIAKATPTVESYEVSEISYQQTLANSTFSNVVAKLGDINVPGTAVWKTTTIAPTVSDSQNTEYTAVFTPNDTTNFENVEFEAKLTVNPIDITGVTVTGAIVDYDNNYHESVSVEGTIAGDTVEYSTNGEDFSLEKPQIRDAGETTVYVRVTRNNNYNVYNTNVKATVNPAVLGNVHFNVYTGTYDRTAHKAVTVGSPIINGTDPVDHYVYNGTNYSECPEFIDAGDYEFTVVLSNNYVKDGTREVVLTASISPKDTTITAKDRNVVYKAADYTAIPDNAEGVNDYATYTLLGNDTLVSCEPDGAAKNASDTPYNVGLKNAVISRGEFDNSNPNLIKKYNDNDITANYNITYPTGKLTIAKKDAKITLKDMPNAVYTALAHPAKGDIYEYETAEDRYTITGLVEGAGHKEQLVFAGEATAVGTYEDLLDVSSYTIMENETTDVTANYNVTIEKGTLTISYPVFDNYSYVKDSTDEGVNGWYQKDVTIKADEGYAVCYENTDTTKFTETLTGDKAYGTEGITKPAFAIKQLSTGYVSDVVERNEVKIDKVDPTVYSIEYSTALAYKLLGIITFGFYDAPATVTIRAKDENSDIDSLTYKIGNYPEVTVSKDDLSIDGEGRSYLEIKAPGTEDEIKDTVSYSAKDVSGRVTYSENDNRGIIVDKTAPVIDENGIVYDGSVNNIGDKYYYSGNAKAIFPVSEEYFFDFYDETVGDASASANKKESLKNDVQLVITKNGSDYYSGSAKPDNETNKFSAEFDKENKQISVTIPAAVDGNKNDGDYIIKLVYTDLSDHNVTATTKTLVVDTTVPVIETAYATPVNSASDSEKTVSYYNETNKPNMVLTVTEHNFNPEYFDSDIVGENLANNSESIESFFEAYFRDINNWNKDGDKYTINVPLENYELNYSIDFKLVDNAKNSTVKPEVKYLSYDKTASAIELSVNASLVRKILNGITFGIFDRVVDAKVTITATDTVAGVESIEYSSRDVDGKIGSVANKILEVKNPYVSNKTTGEGVSISESNQKVTYTFTVPAEYRNGLVATVKDYSNNINSTNSIVNKNGSDGNVYGGIIKDKTNPTLAITVDENANYASKDTFATDFNYHVTVNDDNSGIGSVEVILNGTTITKDAAGREIKDYYDNDNLVEGFSFDINTSQLGSRDSEGVYVLWVQVTDNSHNVISNQYTAYIDVFAPKVTDFSFESKGRAYYGDKAYEQGEKASVADADTTTYSYYFEKNTYVTVYVCDYEKDFNLHTSGVKDISLIAVSNAGESVTCKEVKDSFVQSENGKIGYSTKTFLIEGPFKGDIYAIAEDYAGNTPTNDESKGWVDSLYKGSMSAQYEGFVNPYDTVLEDIEKHMITSRIEIVPNDKPISTEDGQYTYSYPGDGTFDNDPAYKEAKVPLYSSVSLGNRNPNFTITVHDDYSGIKQINWSIIGQADQDSQNNQNGTVNVRNNGSLDGDDGWKAVSNPQNNLIYTMSKTVTVKNDSNDIVILVELTDRAGNKSYDYYILGLDKTAPVVTVNYDNNSASESKYFKNTRTATVTVVDRNFDASLFNVLKNSTRQDVSWSKSTGVNGNNIYTARVGFTSDGDYTFEVNGKDKGRNSAIVTYNGTAPRAFTVDLTDPVVTVTYQSSATAKNGNYYNAPRTANIVVNEHNWNPDKFIFTLRMNDGTAQRQKLSWSNSGDTHTAKFTADSKTGDKYTLDFECKDRADRNAIFVQNGSRVRDYKPETFFVDQQNPTISYDFNGKDTQESMNETTNKEFSSSVGVKDTYYDFVSIDIFGKAHSRNLPTIRTSNTSVDIDSVIEAISKDDKVKDDFYTLTITANDKAGNTSKIVRYFAINRNGSIFTLGEAAANLVEKKYTNNKNDLKQVTIRERNIDPINVTKSVLQLNVDGKVITLEHGKDYSVSGGGTRESNGYYNVVYTIKEAVFANDATYKLLVTTTDAAGNTSKNYKKKGQDPADKDLPILTFIHDETAPIININLDKSKKDSFYSINANEYLVKFTPVDDGAGIDYNSISLSIGRGDKARTVNIGDEEYQFKFDKKTGEYSFVLKGNNYDVTLNYKDKAGNDFEQLIFEHIGISSNVFQRFFYNTGLFIGVLVGIVVVAAAVIVLIAMRKKKKANEEA